MKFPKPISSELEAEHAFLLTIARADSISLSLIQTFLARRPKNFGKICRGIIHLYQATIGPGSFPADIGAFYEQVPLWQGDVEEGEALAKRLMADAVAAKSAVIPDEVFLSIEQGGILSAVRLREFGDEVLATFYDPVGGLGEPLNATAAGIIG